MFLAVPLHLTAPSAANIGPRLGDIQIQHAADRMADCVSAIIGQPRLYSSSPDVREFSREELPQLGIVPGRRGRQNSILVNPCWIRRAGDVA
jgi:hypothetical protein